MNAWPRRTLAVLPAWGRHLALSLLLLLVGLNAWAHKASDAYLTLSLPPALEGEVQTRWDIALRDLDRDLQLDRNDDGQLDWGEVKARWPDIQALAVQTLDLKAAGQACVAQAQGEPQLDSHSDGRYAVLLHRWQCPGRLDDLQAHYRLFGQTDPTHRGIAVVRQADAAGVEPQAHVLSPGGPPVPLTAAAAGGEVMASAPQGFTSFLAEGWHHILIGTDHVLFLLVLLLPAVLVREKALPSDPGRWVGAPRFVPVLGDVVRVVTAFTIAHSITLGLAVFGVLTPPSRWIESIIAASVVLAALNNLIPVVRHNRWKLTFVFGLVHGFGFANALKEVGVSQSGLAGPLLGFNLGVELGQLAIVAVFLAVAWPLRHRPVYRQVLRWGSVAVALIAVLWLVERVFDVSVPYLPI
ncbi:MAG: HupE/UreJ family protein [Pseudomonadota bacterium]